MSRVVMDKSVKPYPPELLPPGFAYPPGYLNLAEGSELPAGFAWWFPNEEFGRAEGAWKLRHYWGANGWKYLDAIDPIPFARRDDLAAFFDGNDRSGDPPVVIADLGNRNMAVKLANFDAWWDRALRESGLR